MALYCLSTETNAQNNALCIQGGYSWTEGIVGVGYEFGYWGIHAGYMIANMPGDNSKVSGVAWNITWGSGNYAESGYYIGIGNNSVGYRSQVSYNGGSYEDNYVTPMWIASVGYKIGSDFMYIKADVGYGWCPDGTGWAYGIMVGFPILRH